MTTVAHNAASKLFVAFVAVAMLFTMVSPAKAATAEELQQMINDLLAQVAALQGSTGGSSAAGMCPYTWTRSLSSGATGMDVMKLQQFLNSDADTRVSMSGVGSAGMETEYFGPATAAAVSKFQVKYRSDVLSPAGLVNPTGYFGPSTMAKANALCVGGTTGGGSDTSDDSSDDSDDSDDDDSRDLSGEASLDTAELEEGDSSAEEGDSDVVVGEFNVEFEDGDAEISRIDVALEGAGTGAEPWEAFDTISLWVDGDMVAEADASDEDEYLDENTGEMRFTGLDIVAMEGDELTISIAVSVQNNLDTAELDDWTLTVESMRYFDADGVATTEGDPADGDEAVFEVEEAGSDEELKISLASSNPDATDIVVDTDSDTNDVTIMVAELEAEDNDIEINHVVVKVETTGATTTDVVDEIRVVIDGQEFEAEAIGTEADYDAAADVDPATGLSEGYSERASASTSVWYYFDIDGDVTIDADDEVEMEVVVDFNDTNDGARYNNGATIEASVTSVERARWAAEGADDLDPSTQIKGTAVGDEHTLVAEGILVPASGFSSETDTLGTNDTIGEFVLEFDVTAVEGDFYITESASDDASTATTGVAYSVDGGAAVVSGTLTSTADEDSTGVFTVREGETETFTLTVTVDPGATGAFRVTLQEVNYDDDATGAASTEAYLPTPASDYRTASQSIQG